MTSDNSLVVGVFKDYSTAQQAARELVNNGIPSGSVHIESNNRTAGAGGFQSGVQSDGETHEGGISGFFHRMFGGEDWGDGEGTLYSKAVESGRTVITVDASGAEAERAAALLEQYGAEDVENESSETNASYTEKRAGNEPNGKTGSSLPVIDEELQVGKRTVQRGGVRIYSRVTERPVEEQVTLRDEHVRIERRPVDRAVSDAELSGLRDQSFEMTETVEEAVVQKRARVTEEVVIGKETTERTEKVRDTLRHTDVEVERFGETGSSGTGAANTVSSNYEQDFQDDWKRNYSSQGGQYSSYAPAYSYGYRAASDKTYHGRSWSDAEPELRTVYERDNPGGVWDRMKNAVRYGWDKVTK